MPSQPSNLKKDPEDWKTGEERATDAQKSYLSTMAAEAGVEVYLDGLTKTEAAEQIEELQKLTGRGQNAN